MKKTFTLILAALMLAHGAAYADTRFEYDSSVVMEESAALSAAYDDQFTQDGITYGVTGDSAEVIGYTKSIAKDIVIPAQVRTYNVTTIADNAFLSCSKLERITISEGITSIGEKSFYGCTKAVEISIPSTVAEIGEYAFRDMDSLEKITVSEDNSVYSTADGALIGNSTTLLLYPASAQAESYHIPDGVVTVSEYAFNKALNLKSVTMADSVKTLDQYAFAYAKALENITIGEGVARIESSALRDCTSLKELHLPASVGFFDAASIRNCSSLESITIDENNKNFYVSEDVIYGNKKQVVAYPPASKRETVSIADGTLRIDDTAFWHCRNIKEVIIPDSLESIEQGAFTACASLTSFTAGDGLDRIGEFAFQNCINLSEVNLNEGLYSIGAGAFAYNYALKEITIPAQVDYIGYITASAFLSCTSLESINVAEENTNYCSVDGVLFDKSGTTLLIYPSGKKDTSYTIPENAEILTEGAFYANEYLAEICVNESNKTYSSSDGVLFSKDMTVLYAYPAAKTQISYEIPDGVTVVGAYAFYGNETLEDIVFPETIIKIDSESFRGCVNLTEINLPEGLESIGTAAFLNCDGLKTVTIPSTVKAIYNQAFDYCDGLEYMTFLSEVPPSCDNICINSNQLAYIYVPEGTQIAYKDEFSGNSKLKIASGAMVVEGEKVPLEDVLGGLVDVETADINTLAQSYIRLTRAEKTQVSDAYIKSLEDIFTSRNTELSASLESEVASLSASGYALASGVSEGEVVLSVEEKAAVGNELLRFDARLSVNDDEQQVKAPVLFTIRLPDGVGSVNVTQLGEDGNTVITPVIENGVLTFRAASTGTFVISEAVPSTIVIGNGTATVTAGTKAVLVTVEYDNGRLTEVTTSEVEPGERVIDIKADSKLFLWKDINGMEPLCEAE